MSQWINKDFWIQADDDGLAAIDRANKIATMCQSALDRLGAPRIGGAWSIPARIAWLGEDADGRDQIENLVKDELKSRGTPAKVAGLPETQQKEAVSSAIGKMADLVINHRDEATFLETLIERALTMTEEQTVEQTVEVSVN